MILLTIYDMWETEAVRKEVSRFLYEHSGSQAPHRANTTGGDVTRRGKGKREIAQCKLQQDSFVKDNNSKYANAERSRTMYAASIAKYSQECDFNT